MSAPDFVTRLQEKLLRQSELNKTQTYYIASDQIKCALLCIFSFFVIFYAFFLNTPIEIFEGLSRILIAPSILITDYMAVGNPGAAFFNSGVLMFICIAIAARVKVPLNGPVIAAIFTVGGFALFGKSMFNIWPIIGGVYLYSLYRKEKFSRFLLQALFGTALGPLVSLVAFGLDFPLRFALPLSIIIGLAAGFILPPMANHFVVFHQGYNLYNVGFTCGIAGMLIMALFRAFGLNAPSIMILSEGHNLVMAIFLMLFFSLMLLTGLFFTRVWLVSMRKLFMQPGRLVSDFVSSEGFGPSLVNMGLLGLISTGFVLAVSGQLNGPSIGGIFTVVGFGAFGKHVRNVIPIMLGVWLASLIKIWDPSATVVVLAALFGTTLAPIAGSYGWAYGIIAGFVHMAVVMNVGILHGGINLYNNGFAGGFVAAVVVPIFDAVRSRFQKESG